MKKIALILALVSLMALCFSSLTVNAAPPKIEDYFPQIAAPTEEEAIYPTSWNYFVGVRQLENPVGQWSWANTFDGKDACWGMNNGTTVIDADLKTIFWNTREVDFTDKNATHVRQIVFADTFTQSGLGDSGRHNPEKKLEDFEQLTVIYSADGENWSTVGFTAAYHTETTPYTDYYGKEIVHDTFWHLVLDEPIPVEQCTYMGFHTSEAKAWDAQDHAYSMCVILSQRYCYLVKDTGSDPVLTYPETEGETTVADTTVADDTTEADTTVADTTVADTTVADGTAAADVTEAGNSAESEGGSGLWIALAIGGGVVILAVIITVAVKKKK